MYTTPNIYSLHSNAIQRQAAYRSLFSSHIEGQLLEAIRVNSNKGMAIGNLQFKQEIEAMKREEVAQWFISHPGLGEWLDMRVIGGGSGTKPIVISGHVDEIANITRGYGDGQKPDDYLKAFKDFINANSNRLVAIQTIIQGPW
jgi:hypothetical protein